MKGGKFMHRLVVCILLALSGIFAVASIFMHVSPLDTKEVAHHVSARTQHRMDLLDSYCDRLLDHGSAAPRWMPLEGFPDDMVIYRYVGDTLSSWYNLFSVGNDDISARAVVQTIGDPRMSLSSPLASVGEKASYINLGPNWYLAKMREEGSVKLVEGLLVKSELTEEGGNGINRNIRVHGQYAVLPLSVGEGEPVYVDSEPVFTIATTLLNDPSAANTLGINLRFVSLILLLASLLLSLFYHRSLKNMGLFTLVLAAAAFACRSLGTQLSDYIELFSPALYANDSFLNSFGTLLIFNLAIFLGSYALYISRWEIIKQLQCSITPGRKTSFKRLLVLSQPFVLLALLLFYTYKVISSLVVNSSITLDLYHINETGLYTLLALLSLGMLFVAAMMLAQISVQLLRPEANILRPGYILAIAAIWAAVFTIRTSQLGFVREQSRVQLWSSRLALDRDLVMELQLRHIEENIASDPIIYTLAHLDGAEKLLLRRLDEMYFGGINADYDVSVRVSRAPALEFARQFGPLFADSSPVGPQSRFFYTYNPASGSRYTGLFQYPSQDEGFCSFIIGITPKVGNLRQILSPGSGRMQVGMPAVYSHARYSDNRLVSFDGSFAYPTVLDALIDQQRQSKSNFVLRGYRHFVNRISEGETIIVTRIRRGAVTYFVSFTYIAFYLFVLGLVLRGRSRKDGIRNGFFSTRMRRLVIISLTVTLVLMASVSALFVYQRNQRGRDDQLSSKISSLQLMLGGACRQMESAEQMMTPQFLSSLGEIAATAGQSINLYTPDGRLLVSSSPDVRNSPITPYRLDPEAFQAICIGHQRYFISKKRMMGHTVHVLYAPVFNSVGSSVAIANSIYVGKDFDFTRDAVFHAATVVSLFLILLLVTVVLFSSITKSIFRPLLAMGQKMKGVNTTNLEKIDYQGDDEISSLVGAYNDMVEDLRESTVRLTAAERDKAWSEMARQVAHEIKNPLTPIKLEIQRIQRLKQKGDPSWQEKFDAMSEVVLEHIDILSQTANEFSTFAKLYSEDPVDVDLDKALRDEIMLFSSNERVKVTYLGAADAVVRGPKPQLIRVFVNLISNAVQAVEAQDDPAVLVCLRRGENPLWWDIAVEDNGPGVSEENLGKLFTPNFTTKSSGTGLGLAISRNIVERCGGSIKYSKSFSLGGACFTVSLPSNKQDTTI